MASVIENPLPRMCAPSGQEGAKQQHSAFLALSHCTESKLERDFVSDALFNGKRFRALTLIDNLTRENFAIEVGQSLTGQDLVLVLQRIYMQRQAAPIRIQADNGPEFISLALDKWAYDNQLTLDFSRPSKPTDNAFIESFNGSLRNECLNTSWLMSLSDAREKLENWRCDDNDPRPHSALADATQSVFVSPFSPPPTMPVSLA